MTARAAKKDTPYGDRFSLFAECLWLGVLTAVACVPLVTWSAALAAGAAAVRRTQPDGPSPGLARRYLRDLRAALPGGLAVGAGSLLLLGFLLFDIRLVLAQPALPGRPAVLALALLAAVLVPAAGLRAAARWASDRDWRTAVRGALADSRRDPGGTAMLLGAVVICLAVTWQLPVIAPLALGVLALAAVAVQRRTERMGRAVRT
ncbi:hypothetical protein BIV57_19290 [Mangrovactinospora gilvigrisea]|uniref:DUF624 domain-containing protein n=1 Tax=Mangrovactinospora gilvigrisea TaxID=1428644 RepID=A0A1J7BBA9_9ACTN|nr:hypothetical protein [Mangrovactinospora gilvigrisea]OIV35893.1 hypothetical protein BIV57_19290 [Mangrovactinospora gilvigrisea]